LEVRKTDVFSILPFANNVVVLRVPGSVVESMVENSLTGFLRTDVETHPDGRFLQVSPGFRFRWYYDTASGTPVLKVVEVLDSTTGQFALLDKAATYVIAVSSFMATGGDDYSMLEEYYENGMEPPIHEQKAWQYAMEEYLKAVAPSGNPLTSHTVNADASQRRIQQVSEPARVDLALLCGDTKELCDALRFAVNLVNNKTSGFLPNILSSVRLVPHVTHTPCTATVKEPIADLKAGIIASAGSWPGAAIGPFCTDETEIFTTAAGSTTVYFSYGASTPSLADDTTYPNLIRTIMPENLANRGYVAIMKKYKWTKMGIVSEAGNKWAEQSALDLLEQFTASAGVVLNSDQMGYDLSSEQPADIMGRLQSVRARIVALWLYEPDQRDIYSYLFQTGLWEGALISCFASTSILQTPSGGVDTGAVSGATGLIALLPKAAGSVLSTWVASWGSNASQSECTQNTLCCCDSDGDKASLLPYTQLAVDAFMLYVHALDRVSVNDLNDGTKIYEQVLQLSDSQGISGSVSLDSHGDRLGNFDFLNLQVIDTTQSRRLTAKRGLLARVPLTSTSAEFVVVGEYDEATDELKMTDAQAKSVKFPGGQSCPVPGELPCVEDDVPESPGTVVEEFNYKVIIIIIACIIVGFCCILACFQYNYKRQIFSMRQDLDELKKTMVGVEAVVQDFDPHTLDGGVMMAPVAEPKTAYRSYWYWQEDSSRLKAHNQNDIFPPNFVKYAGSVNAELETAWNAFRDGTGPSKFKIDLTERIASTGTERKAYAEDSGCNFEIDFTQMKQVNLKTGHSREILRREEIMTTHVDATRSVESNAFERKKSGVSVATNSRQTNSVGKSENDFTERPDDLRGEPFLILFVGQIVQTSQKRTDGWTFGSVIFDEVQDRPNVPTTPSTGSIDDDPDDSQGISTVSGWFPKICVDKPSSAQMKKLHEVMGGHGANVLAEPSTWTPMKDAQKFDLIPLADGKEKQDCIDAFKKTLKPNVKINSVSRVQNVSLWQSYSVKKQTMMSLAAKNDPPVERVWLFHGTSSESVPKILQSGFNRSFCGKNATFYGKGAYFARDSSYSAQPAYCTPDTNGVQRVFLCKVAVGSYCLGKKDAPAPDIKEGSTLYDSTVDNMRDPSIYVTYHDGQAYPDYLLEFTQPN
jgi:poly [ADP-ribose] polymerase 10/14/15